MFKVFFKEGPDGPIEDKLVTADPKAAESHYWKLCVRRTEGPGAVRLFSDLPDVVPPGYYRTDRGWTGPRECDPGRVEKGGRSFRPPSRFDPRVT